MAACLFCAYASAIGYTNVGITVSHDEDDFPYGPISATFVAARLETCPHALSPVRSKDSKDSSGR